MSGKTKELLIEFLGIDTYVDMVVENQLQRGKNSEDSLDNLEIDSDKGLEEGKDYLLKEIINEAILWMRTEQGHDFWHHKHNEWRDFLKEKGIVNER